MTLHLRLIVVIALLAIGASAQKLAVIATQPDLADFATRIGGDFVEVESLSQGHEDIHNIRTKPSTLVKLRKADVFLQIGLSLEHSWVPALLAACRNDKIRPGGPGFVNCAAGIKPLGVPSDRTRGAGPDIHVEGNPHYNLDPEAMRTVMHTIRDALTRAMPEHETEFKKGCDDTERILDERLAVWKERLLPFKGASFIEYHDAWMYFAARFSLEIVGRLEPKPGLAPTPEHLARVIDAGRSKKVGLVVARPAMIDVAEKVAHDIGAAPVALTLSSTTGGDTKGYFAFMDKVVDTFAKHLERP